jgi:hypothetical protein
VEDELTLGAKNTWRHNHARFERVSGIIRTQALNCVALFGTVIARPMEGDF